MKIAYHYDYKTLTYQGESQIHKVAGYDEYILPQLSTWVAKPDFDKETEQVKFDVKNQKWLVELKPIEVTAYHKQNREPKVFEDVFLITGEYTQKKPLTPWDEWINGSWVTNLSNKHIADYDAVDNIRRSLYREISDPLYMESYRKKENGLLEEAAIFKSQADAAVEEIQAKHPFPIAPVI